jgi:flagellin-specific chaperone FliS
MTEKVQKENGFDKTLKEIKNLVKADKRIREKAITTGNSFFLDSDRFCKLVKTKNDIIYLELNVKLSQETIKKIGPNLQTFSKVEASKKHLGTLVHILKSKDEKEVLMALKEAWKIFQEQHKPSKPEKKQEVKPKEEVKQEVAAQLPAIIEPALIPAQ